MHGLQINLLGEFAVRLHSKLVTEFRSAKARAILAYIAAAQDRGHSRTHLATLLWGDLGESAARTNLRIELSSLKQLLSNHPALDISRHSVTLHSAEMRSDVQTFRTAMTTFLALPVESQAKNLSRLTGAIQHYKGEFLAGFQVNDTPEFEEWLLLMREQLHQEMMVALETLQLRYAELGQWPALADAARQQLDIVPWAESAHRNLMQALAAQGQSHLALDHYAQYRTLLQKELGLEPSLSTTQIAERIQSRHSAPLAIRHNLTQPLKSFVGRHEEIAQMRGLIRAERLVTLLGVGGVGKSHLAQAVAQHMLLQFSQSVWFVPLGCIDASAYTPQRIALAIAAAGGLPLTGAQTPLAALIANLAGRQMLLVLDGWDHLIESADMVLNALLRHTAVHILATSRIRLMAEREIPVGLNGLLPVEALKLFVERARAIVPSFAKARALEVDREIYAICEYMAGLPLGIELAASWIEHLSVSEIGQSIAKIAREPQPASEVANHRNRLSSVFEHSWRLLSSREQQLLAQLSVFRGGFCRRAAASLATGGLGELSSLIGHSLVQRVTSGRYELHPLIREFASGKLTHDQMVLLHQQHSRYFLGMLCAMDRTQWQSVLLVDFENLRSAWQQAIVARDQEMIDRAAKPFGEFMTQAGLMLDTEQAN